MADYITPAIESDPTTIEDSIYSRIQAAFPSWVPEETDLSTLISEALSERVDEILTLAASVPADIFRYFGPLVGINPVQAAFASGTTTWTVRDTQGYTIPSGTNVRKLIGGETYAYFTTVGDVSIPAGSSSTTAGQVVIAAVEEGAAYNGLTGSMELLDVLDYVTGVTLTAPTYGGADEDDIDTFLNNLANRLQLMADRPILAADFAIYARTVPGVYRALGIDNYNPVDQTFNNEKMVTIVAVDTNGAAVSGAVKANIVSTLEAVREWNFVVNTADPTYNTLNIVVTATATSGSDIAAVQSAVLAQLASYLSPATWGVNPLDPTDTTGWTRQTTIRLYELASLIDRVVGVDYVNNITINGIAADYTMTGVAPLPDGNPYLTVTINAAA